MTGFEPGPTGYGSNHSTNCVTAFCWLLSLHHANNLMFLLKLAQASRCAVISTYTSISGSDPSPVRMPKHLAASLLHWYWFSQRLNLICCQMHLWQGAINLNICVESIARMNQLTRKKQRTVGQCQWPSYLNRLALAHSVRDSQLKSRFLIIFIEYLKNIFSLDLIIFKGSK